MEGRKEKYRKRSITRVIAIVIIAVIFVPLLYSGIYLSAFWDPYGHFDRVPVAFVNLDKQVVKDGKTYHVGQDLQNNLKDDKQIGWHFVSYDEGKKGIRGTAYYALIIIPSDFSQKIAESSSGKIQQPTIIYEGNKGKNYVFAQVSERAAENIKSEISSIIQEETTRALAKSLFDVRDSLKTAGDGAKKLYDGTIALSKGSESLSTGLKAAASGSNQLQAGLKSAATGQTDIKNEIDSLVNGLQQFKNGFTQNTENISALSAGASSVSAGLQEITSKTEGANLSTGLTTTADSIAQIKGAISQVSSILTTSTDQESIEQARGILTQLVANINSENLEDKLRSSAIDAGELTANLKKLNSGSKQVSDGTKALTAGLAATQSQAASGVNKLLGGATQLQKGSRDLQKGLNTAVQKNGELTSGLTQLRAGAEKLDNGIDKVSLGAFDLQGGLMNGYKKLNDSLTFTVQDISNYIKNPLRMKDETINKVKYYGEGLAPYFISLSLWLGTMFMNLIVSLIKLSNTVQSKFLKTYTGTFISGSILVILQAIILSLILVEGLGLEPVNLPLFYLGNMFVSVVFFSIMYGITYAIGLIGTPIVFVLFILQLASSGGTFPIETSPKFFRAISPYFPMTYTVEGLRMIISGINSSRLLTISTILLGFLLLFYAGGFVFNRVFKGFKNLKAEPD
ncbi:YhgE/Pip family protein [Cytobacillus sp. Hz8]|uniref:YhgE/Pip family protein n=1 Tax=Cytobacillus sp. Hz8 TaxID=3347168 RepID=UPI0035D90CE9